MQHKTYGLNVGIDVTIISSIDDDLLDLAPLDDLPPFDDLDVLDDLLISVGDVVGK